jgi:hypothetical protein
VVQFESLSRYLSAPEAKTEPLPLISISVIDAHANILLACESRTVNYIEAI